MTLDQKIERIQELFDKFLDKWDESKTVEISDEDINEVLELSNGCHEKIAESIINLRDGTGVQVDLNFTSLMEYSKAVHGSRENYTVLLTKVAELLTDPSVRDEYLKDIQVKEVTLDAVYGYMQDAKVVASCLVKLHMKGII
ncbi:MAG: hypothetical protein IJ593_07625 [Lachnospiraceae bacterium]|nr:hypothetical protein [Lachnospiraceae bacterium]